MNVDAHDLARLVSEVLNSRKYREMDDRLIRRIGQCELAARHNLKDAIKATRNKLHQIGGVYFAGEIDYRQALADLRRTAEDDAAFRAVCADLMRRHASTRERLPILDTFYRTLLAEVGPVQSVMDVACGLNPLALPWMGLPDTIWYFAYDIYWDLMGFLGSYLMLSGGRRQAAVLDVTGELPDEQADLALVLKTLPCLEQIEKGAGLRLLDGLHAPVLIVSFPVGSLGGHGKGMRENYEAQFRGMVAGRGWDITRFEFKTELAFVVRKG